MNNSKIPNFNSKIEFTNFEVTQFQKVKIPTKVHENTKMTTFLQFFGPGNNWTLQTIAWEKFWGVTVICRTKIGWDMAI